MPGTKWVLKVNGSEEDLIVSGSKLGKVFHSEDLRDVPVQQGLRHHLGLQHSDNHSGRGDRTIISVAYRLRKTDDRYFSRFCPVLHKI